MTTAKFGNLEVLTVQDRGQCESCKRGVVRVLVQNPNGTRSWHCADIGHFGYVTHDCGPSHHEFKHAA